MFIYFLRENFIFEDLKNNYEYYEFIIIYDLLFLFVIFSIFVVEFGYLDKVYEYFVYIVRMDFDDLNDNIKDGIYVVCMGGVW